MDVTGNCRAEAASNQIRCDLVLIDDLINEFRLGDGSGTRTQLLAIILSHELGHIALNHQRASYHGEGGTISVLSYASHKQELEADAFAVELLDRTADPISGVYRLIEYLARTAEHRSLCPKVFPAPCPCPDHPDCQATLNMPQVIDYLERRSGWTEEQAKFNADASYYQARVKAADILYNLAFSAHIDRSSVMLYNLPVIGRNSPCQVDDPTGYPTRLSGGDGQTFQRNYAPA